MLPLIPRLIPLAGLLCGWTAFATDAPPAGAANLFPNPGFEEVGGGMPDGWSGEVWNKLFTRCEYVAGVPGRDGTGRCLELPSASPMGVMTVRSPAFDVPADTTFVFKAHYASDSQSLSSVPRWRDADGVSLTGEWLGAEGQPVGSFLLVLPDTQDRWIEIFEQVQSPSDAKQLRLTITRRWVGGRLRLDDFSLRVGTIADFAKEFSIPTATGDDYFPIYGWLDPGAGILKNEAYKELRSGKPTVTEDRLLAEYALANLTLGRQGSDRFGVKYYAGVPNTDEEIVAQTKDPMFWGFHGPDEPQQSVFPELAKANERIQKLAPGTIYWVNHYPTYGFTNEEFESFEEYRQFLQAYIDQVKPQMFTYDHYCFLGPAEIQEKSWFSPNAQQDYFANLEIARQKAQAAKIKFGQIVLVTAHGTARGASEAELRWQAFTTLAYGATSLGWFTYLTEIPYGNWTNYEDAVLNLDGSRTRHYSMLKYLNAEILRWGPTLNRLTSTGVFHTAPLPQLTGPLEKARLVAGIEGGMALAGEFRDKDARDYVMLVNRDFLHAAKLKVTFRVPPKSLEFLSRDSGQWEKMAGLNGPTLTLDLAAGNAELVRIAK